MAVSESQKRAKEKYDKTHALKTSLDTAIRGARRLGVTGQAVSRGVEKGTLAQAIKADPDRYQEAILNLSTLYGELAREIQGK